MPLTIETSSTLADLIAALDAQAVKGPGSAVTDSNLAKWDGTSGRLLKDGGAGGGGGGSGDVVGPASATDLAIALFDGTTGKLIEDSGVTLADLAGVVSTAIAAHEAASDPHTGYQRESEKASAGGYASLDGSTKVPIAQIPTGTSSSTVALGDAPASAVSTHAALTATHGVSGAIVGTSDAQTLTNKTLTDPTINAASGVLIPPSSTSFPGSPSTGQRHYRSDLRTSFTYDGTRWLSDVFPIEVGNARGTGVANYSHGYSPSDTTNANAPLAFSRKLRIIALAWGMRVGTGGATWTLGLRVNGAGSDTFTAANTIAGSAGTWVQTSEEAVGLTLAAGERLEIRASRTGTETYGAWCSLVCAWEAP